jgi:response regulator RpfG family c-di-GMP phosphodiesterase
MKRTIKVLIVDDEQTHTRLMNNALATHKIRVTFYEKESVAEALEFLATGQHIDLALFDLNFPGENIEALIRAMKASKQYVNVPIIVISVDDNRSAWEKMREMGVPFYIVKPINEIKMRQIVEWIPHFYWTIATDEVPAQEAIA